jgi:hypothetical protein
MWRVVGRAWGVVYGCCFGNDGEGSLEGTGRLEGVGGGLGDIMGSGRELGWCVVEEGVTVVVVSAG